MLSRPSISWGALSLLSLFYYPFPVTPCNFFQYLAPYKTSSCRPDARHLLSTLAMLAMASAQSTSLATSVTDSTSTLTTSSLTDTSIVFATGTAPPVTGSTINFISASLPTATATSSATSSTSHTPSVPAIAGIAAGGAFLLIAAIILITFACIKRRRKAAERWPELPPKTGYSTARPISLGRPSSAATLVAAPYTHSKGSSEHGEPSPLHYTKSTRSTHSMILERVSEETVRGFKFDSGVPPPLEHVESHASGAAIPPHNALIQSHDDTLQKLSLDKSLPCSPEDEIPTALLDLNRYPLRAEDVGTPRSSLYSDVTSIQSRNTDSWGGGCVRESEGYF